MSVAAACGVLVPRVVTAAVLTAVAIVGVAWHWSGRRNFRLDRMGRQANPSKARNGLWGGFSFGTVLGLGVLTRMASPLVMALILTAAALPLGLAEAIGLGFGLGRSVVAAAGAAIGGRLTPESVVTAIVVPQRSDRVIASTAGVICIGGLWWLLLSHDLGCGALWWHASCAV